MKRCILLTLAFFLVAVSGRAQESVLIKPDTVYSKPYYQGFWYFTGSVNLINQTDDSVTILEGVFKDGKPTILPQSSRSLYAEHNSNNHSGESPLSSVMQVRVARHNATRAYYQELSLRITFINRDKLSVPCTDCSSSEIVNHDGSILKLPYQGDKEPWSSYSVFSSAGQMIRAGKLTSPTVSIGHLGKGVFLLVLYSTSGQTARYRFIK